MSAGNFEFPGMLLASGLVELEFASWRPVDPCHEVPARAEEDDPSETYVFLPVTGAIQWEECIKELRETGTNKSSDEICLNLRALCKALACCIHGHR